MTELLNFEFEGWQLKARLPGDEIESPPLVLMLHGLTGDENSMGVFAPRIPPQFTLLFPQGPYPYAMGGFSWIDGGFGAWPAVHEFDTSIQSLRTLLTRIPTRLPVDRQQVHLAGFSQGAALAYIYALSEPDGIQSLVGLSGFMPTGADLTTQAETLGGVKAFVAHGTNDHLVPVSRARGSVTLLERAGAQVTYCETEGGHKLSATCFRAMGKFYKSLLVE